MFWVHASSYTLFEHVYRNFANVLNLPGREDPGVDILQLVCQWLQEETNGSWFLILDDADDANIVSAVIGIGNSLHMRVTAEGIETREQLEFLQQHGCPAGQGFYFSRPVPAAEFATLLQRGLANTAIAA